MSTATDKAEAATNDVMVAAYKTIEPAKKDFDALVKAVEDKKVSVAEGVILVTHDADGEVHVTDAADHHGRRGLEYGGGVGILVGLFSPPLLATAVIGAAVGGLVGKFVKHRKDSGLEQKVGEAMPKGSAGIIVMVTSDEREALEKLLSGALMTSVAAVEGEGLKALKEGLVEAAKISVAAKAYIYGYPLVYSLEEIAKFPAGEATLMPGKRAFNEFAMREDLCGPETTFVSPNNDTIYALIPFDLSGGPLLLHVPDTHDRYYVIQCIDAWSNNFAYIGRRATGTDEATFLITPPGWKGTVPDGIKAVIEAPTTIGMFGGRVQVDGDADLPAVQAIGKGFTITPMEGNGPLEGIGTSPTPGVDDDLAWWEKFRQAIRQFSPLPPSDAAVLPVLEQLGVTAAESPYVSPDPDLAEVLEAGAEAGQATIEGLMQHAVPLSPNGWGDAAHAFDYNVDYLQIGTIDAPEWKVTDPAQRYALRAVVARLGLWGNSGYEADYAQVWVDGDGAQLDGSHRYELRIDELPPVDAFWSLTMYDVPDFYLVANPIKRYSIGDRTPGLKYGDDGSVTIYIQNESPGKDKESNWLPAPEGQFRPIMRMYQPRKEILDHSYQLPAIKKVS